MPTEALAQSVKFDEAMMHVSLTDGRVVSVPLVWFPRLSNATPDQLQRCQMGAGGRGLHGDELDEDLNVAGLMAGADWRSA